MKKIILSVILILVSLIFCADSCDRSVEDEQRREEERFLAGIDSTVRSLGSVILSDRNREILEMKAKEKLEDFADYLQIYMEGSLEDQFRAQTAAMIRALFISDTIPVELSSSTTEKTRKQTLKDLLSTDFRNTRGCMYIRFDSVHLIEPLQRMDSVNYLGVMGFVERCGEAGDGNFRSEVVIKRRVDIIAWRINRQFGSENVMIWKIFLGGIR